MTKSSETTDDEVIKDGQTVTVRMNLMDSALDTVQRAIIAAQQSNTLHAPGSLATTDAERDRRAKLYEDRDKRLTDAWKNPPSLDPGQTVRTITPASSADRYAARDARLEQAWRSA